MSSEDQNSSSSSQFTCTDDWTSWIDTHTAQQSLIPADYGLGRISHFLGKSQTIAYQLALDGADAEAVGDIQNATKKYKAAYRKWPSLDSCIVGGIPMDVRIEAINAGYLNDSNNVLLDVVDVQKARASKAICSKKRILTDDDILALYQMEQDIYNNIQPPFMNNPENLRHHNKQACMMNNPPEYKLQVELPEIVGKILQFAQWAWKEGKWSSNPDSPLENVVKNKDDGILKGLSIRVIELWEYSKGGGLTDPYHYDTDSIITIVTLLSDPDNDFVGGEFRTFEVDESHRTYSMNKGDSIAFVSHKYHNITELVTGCRRSLVIELWQGGIGHSGR